MPFTPAHAVVALPFVRTPLVPAAIAVGAMTPDLPLFVRGTAVSYAITHSFAWVPSTALIALGLLLVWRAVLRPATRELSPRWLAERLPSTWDGSAAVAAREIFALRGRASPSWRGTALLVVALVIGVLSHIAWDLFTHEGRWGVTVVPLLAERWGPFEGFRWLQHGSSALGLAILAGWALWWLRRAEAAAAVDRVLPAWARRAWWLSLPVVLTLAWVVGLATLGPLTSSVTVAHIAYRVLPPACAVWGALTLVLCLAVPALRRRG